LMKLMRFSNRSSFECGLHKVLDHNIRLDSIGNLGIGYGDMVIYFEDVYHFQRAEKLLKEAKLTFIVDEV
jgi:hypothetical protein